MRLKLRTKGCPKCGGFSFEEIANDETMCITCGKIEYKLPAAVLVPERGIGSHRAVYDDNGKRRYIKTDMAYE